MPDSRGGRGDLEWIPLRAALVEYADGSVRQAIVLPDGRILMDGYQTYHSERALVHLNPGAKLIWVPEADATINHVMDIP